MTNKREEFDSGRLCGLSRRCAGLVNCLLLSLLAVTICLVILLALLDFCMERVCLSQEVVRPSMAVGIFFYCVWPREVCCFRWCGLFSWRPKNVLHSVVYCRCSAHSTFWVTIKIDFAMGSHVLVVTIIVKGPQSKLTQKKTNLQNSVIISLQTTLKTTH